MTTNTKDKFDLLAIAALAAATDQKTFHDALQWAYEEIQRLRGRLGERTDDAADAEFQRFYDAYPRKVGKPAARRAWAGARRKAEAEAIFNGLQRWLAYWRDKDSQFVAHPSTWLNQERWNDDPGLNGREYATNDQQQQALAKLRERVTGNTGPAS